MSKTRFDILASAAQSATAQGGQISVSGVKNLGLFIDVTSVSGSVTALYLQSSSDGGTTWFDILAETATFLTSGSAAVTSSTTPVRNVNVSSPLSTGNTAKLFAQYKTMGDLVRAAWVIAGSGPSCTFSFKGIGEN